MAYFAGLENMLLPVNPGRQPYNKVPNRLNTGWWGSVEGRWELKENTTQFEVHAAEFHAWKMFQMQSGGRITGI